MTTFADGLEVVVDGFRDVFLELTRSAHADFFCNLNFGPAGADGSRGEKARYAGAVLGIKRDHALGVGLALLDALGGLLCGHGDVDGVVVALAHLATVKAGKQGHVGEKGVDLGEDRVAVLAEAVVKAAGDGARELDVGQLVATDGNHVALAEEDVAGLVHGIGEEQARELVAAGLLLGFDGGVAQELRLGDEREEAEA